MNPQKQPVVLQVIPALGAGGAEQGCIDVAKALVEHGAKAIVVSNGGMRVSELTRANVLHINMPVHSKNPFVINQNAKRLKKIILQHKVDIVHARSRAPGWSCLKACRETSARFMTTCHAPYNIKDSKLKRFYNSVMARGELVIAISQFVADYLLKNYEIAADKIRLVPRGVPIEKFNPALVKPERMIKLAKAWRVPDGALVIIMPGRLTRWKGQIVMIEAMAKLKRSDIICVMVGADQGRSEYREELENLIKARGIEGQIRLTDHCDDMPAAYMLATIVVSASIEPEGFGRVAVEGQAMGRLTIATDHGGSKETIIPGETGWLVTPNDADAMAKAMNIALCLNEDEKTRITQNAMAHVHHNFTREMMVGKTLDVYAELLR